MKSFLLLAVALLIAVTVVSGRRGRWGLRLCDKGANEYDDCTKKRGPVLVCKDKENPPGKLACVPNETVCYGKGEEEACSHGDYTGTCMTSRSCEGEDKCPKVCVIEGRGNK